jgi:hypothetical protein
MRAVRISLLVVSLIALVLLPAVGVRAQDPPPDGVVPAPVTIPPEITEAVKKQFGPCFQVARERSSIKVKYLHPPVEAPWLAYFTADLNGDGVEDLVVVARCNNPLANEIDFDYTVVDPYYTANGYGNPRITAAFNSGDPGRNNLVLVILGSEKEGWHAEHPVGKWVLINLPFDRVAASHVMLGKKKKAHKAAAVGLEENDEGGSSVVFWDGKKWRWSDLTGH